jgi:hypothetical protein
MGAGGAGVEGCGHGEGVDERRRRFGKGGGGASCIFQSFTYD